ncbi:MAG: hypothetical protein WKG06_10990 [Segetibacter sp.]
MFDELNKYKNKDHFFLKPTDNLSQVCNAPDSSKGMFISGIYIVYALSKGRIDLVYIGRSGEKGEDKKIKNRKAGCGGLKDRIINGKDSDKVSRRKSWIALMKSEGIEALDIYWYVTYNGINKDFPEDVERALLQQYINLYGQLPRWNRR